MSKVTLDINASSGVNIENKIKLIYETITIFTLMVYN